MKKAWIIIGESNKGKSSLIRGLTAIRDGRKEGNPNFVFITRCDGLTFRLYPFVSALQESGTDIKKLDSIFANKNNNPKDNIQNILVPLRYDSANGCPDGEKYVDHLIRNDWEITSIVSLGEYARKWGQESGCPFTSYFPTSNEPLGNMPPNELVSQVRKNFGWM